jgi:uncharacterized membrane protein SirB2
MKLSLLSICLGLGLSLPQIYGLMSPSKFAEAARKFPRSVPIGWTLMLLGTAWFVYIVNYEPIADFSAYKTYMMIGFAAVGVLACIFVSDFLAVRGLAVVLMLLGKLMVDTGRPHLGESGFVLVNQTLAYFFVVIGMWLTITPWRLRDWLSWLNANEQRIRVGCGLRLAFFLFIASLGFTAFRTM